jgi:uncharacterized protein
MFRHFLSALVLAATLVVLPAGHPARASAAATKLDETLAFTGYVVDQARVLSDADRRALTDRLGRFQHDTGHQIAVATVTSLHGEDIKPFSITLANRWGIGRKLFNDGILILVAPNERQARIAIGRGLEQALPDDFCQSVMERALVPAFRKKAYGEGIDAGVTAIIDRLAAMEKKAAA